MTEAQIRVVDRSVQQMELGGVGLEGEVRESSLSLPCLGHTVAPLPKHNSALKYDVMRHRAINLLEVVI